MRNKSLQALLLLVASFFAANCASTRQAAPRPVKPSRIFPADSSFDSSAGAREMRLDNEMGVYDNADIDQTLAEQIEGVRACYYRAGRARRYVAGTVTLRFLVSGDGKTDDVWVVGTELGNFGVERCLVELGRKVKFPPPLGARRTTFDYPFLFRSSHQTIVQDLDASLKLERDLAGRMHQLGACGSVVARGGATAIFYIQPGGMIGSVGLATESALDQRAGACLVREMLRWRMSASLPGRMLRYRASIRSASSSTAAEASAGSLVLTASRRRRR